MAPKAEDARLRYLNSISQELLASSPAASAHLQLTRHTIAEDDNVALDEHGRICGACGSSLILGWSSKRVKTCRGKTTHSSGISDRGAKDARVRCERCGAVTSMQKVKADRKTPQHAISKVAAFATIQQQPAVQDSSPTQPKPAESNTTTSRKRSRNKRSSLQSMLKASQESSKTSKSSGYGLDLHDLMEP